MLILGCTLFFERAFSLGNDEGIGTGFRGEYGGHAPKIVHDAPFFVHALSYHHREHREGRDWKAFVYHGFFSSPFRNL